EQTNADAAAATKRHYAKAIAAMDETWTDAGFFEPIHHQMIYAGVLRHPDGRQLGERRCRQGTILRQEPRRAEPLQRAAPQRDANRAQEVDRTRQQGDVYLAAGQFRG